MFNVIFISTSKKTNYRSVEFQFNSKESGICNAHQYKLVGERKFLQSRTQLFCFGFSDG